MFTREDEIKARALEVNVRYMLAHRNNLMAQKSEQDRMQSLKEMDQALEATKDIVDYFCSLRQQEPEQEV